MPLHAIVLLDIRELRLARAFDSTHNYPSARFAKLARHKYAILSPGSRRQAFQGRPSCATTKTLGDTRGMPACSSPPTIIIPFTAADYRRKIREIYDNTENSTP